MIRKDFDSIRIEFHGHNDLGMATANTVAAVMAGCESFSATVNGIGERAGNALLEETVMAIKHTLNKKINIRTEKLSGVCTRISEITKIQLSVNKPVVGDNNFRHESGIHCNALLKDRNTFELYHSDEVGKKEAGFVIGKHSGRSTLIKILNDNGIDIDRDSASELLTEIKQLSVKNKKEITEKELLDVFWNFHLTLG